MPFRRWFAIVVMNGQEHRFGPYATRRAAARKAESHSAGATQHHALLRPPAAPATAAPIAAARFPAELAADRLTRAALRAAPACRCGCRAPDTRPRRRCGRQPRARASGRGASADRGGAARGGDRAQRRALDHRDGRRRDATPTRTSSTRAGSTTCATGWRRSPGPRSACARAPTGARSRAAGRSPTSASRSARPPSGRSRRRRSTAAAAGETLVHSGPHRRHEEQAWTTARCWDGSTSWSPRSRSCTSARATAGSRPGDHERLQEIKVSLDRCWDLLRQRRAHREFGLDPDDARARSADTVEHYQQ